MESTDMEIIVNRKILMIFSMMVDLSVTTTSFTIGLVKYAINRININIISRKYTNSFLIRIKGNIIEKAIKKKRIAWYSLPFTFLLDFLGTYTKSILLEIQMAIIPKNKPRFI